MEIIKNHKAYKFNNKKYDSMIIEDIEKHLKKYDKDIIILIIRNQRNYIIDVQKIKYDKEKFNDIFSFDNYIRDKYADSMSYIYCDYDIECKKKYLFFDSKKNNKLNLDVNFNYLKFSDYYNDTNSNLVINGVLVSGGIGGAGGPGLLPSLSVILTLIDYFCYIFNFIKSLFSYLYPFKIIKKEYGYGKEFLFDIINYSSAWNIGFMNLDKIKMKKTVEKSIMKKFGYKKKKNIWGKNNKYTDYKDVFKKYNNY